MSCAMEIKRHIASLPRDQIFTTGDMLHHGSRSAVDQVLRYLVNNERIQRLCRGVFVRDLSIEPSVLEVARVKAKRFNKEMVQTAHDVLRKFAIPLPKDEREILAVNGRTSHFRYGHVTVRFKGVSNRKVQLGETNVGHILRHLWFLGSDHCLFLLLEKVVEKFGPHERFDLKRCARLAPAWLTFYFKDIHWANYGPEDRKKSVSPSTESSEVPGNQSAPNANEEQRCKRYPVSSKLMNWLRFLPVFRRIISVQVPSADLLQFPAMKAATSHADKLRAIEKFVQQLPVRAPSRFYVLTCRVQLARARLSDSDAASDQSNTR